MVNLPIFRRYCQVLAPGILQRLQPLGELRGDGLALWAAAGAASGAGPCAGASGPWDFPGIFQGIPWAELRIFQGDFSMGFPWDFTGDSMEDTLKQVKYTSNMV